MKVTRKPDGGIVLNGEFNTVVFMSPNGSGVSLEQEGMNKNDTVTGFIFVGINQKIFGSYWFISGEWFRYLYDTGDKGLAFLSNKNTFVLAYEKEIIAEREANKQKTKTDTKLS